MVLRGLKITWVCIAILFISCSIVHFCYFQNTFPFVSTLRQTDDIRKKRGKHFVEQGIVCCCHMTIMIIMRHTVTWNWLRATIVICLPICKAVFHVHMF